MRHHRNREFARTHAGFESSDHFSMHAMWHAIGRHHRHDDDGRFPGGPGGFGGRGDDGMPRGRKFTSDDLQLLLLALLAEAPRHGYELIKALEVRSNGFYSPSPGMVYPALTYLEELGYATVEVEGNRKRYALAESGRNYLATNRERVDVMLAKLSHFARKMDSVRRAFAGETGDENADANGDSNAWLPEFIQARRALKHALLMRTDAPVSEQRRIAAILVRATAEIEGKTAGDPA
ncbi:PadR family transcriptional regulator [Caballeronia sp. 15711]|jgi:DNA-binding PadR family transcriptional regulator|uniref:PadR family transcriptional regulator n=1 Tax=Caballeronia sp. 15711 TaxID=3391029 RepID=UPI0039E48AD8